MPSETDHWMQYGIEPSSQFVSLNYSESARVLVAEFSVRNENGGIHSLYYRRQDEKTYRWLTPHSDTRGYMDAIVAKDSPYAWAITMEWKHRGGNPEGLCRFSLAEIGAYDCLRAKQLDVPTGYTDIWFCRLNRVDDQGKHINSVLGIKKKRGTLGSEVEYWIATINYHMGTYHLLAQLEGVFL